VSVGKIIPRAIALLIAAWLTSGFTFDNRYLSPRNREREVRRSTRFIILHTTEAPALSSIKKVSERGEAHYVVDESGKVFRIVDHRRVAYHCGRSMWDGLTNIDEYSVGIEVVGYHNKNITLDQIITLKGLIGELKGIYKIPDHHVLTHSMVAYGTPNRWQKRNHRGRKRCGMYFARWSIRKQIDLYSKPKFDPDVKSGRLVVADPYLHQVLYSDVHEQDKALEQLALSGGNVIKPGRSAWDIARDLYNSQDTLYIFPNGISKRGNQISDWKSIPSGTKVLIKDADVNPIETYKTLGVDGNTASEITGAEIFASNTFYIKTDSSFKRGSEMTEQAIAALPRGTRILLGYNVGGPISQSKRAFDICGARWKAKDTFFLYPFGLIKAGSEVDETKIPFDAYIFYRN